MIRANARFSRWVMQQVAEHDRVGTERIAELGPGPRIGLAAARFRWPWVSTLLRSVYDQPDAASVPAQYDRLVDAVARKLPAVAAHLDAARPDVLAFTNFPKELWRQIWTDNPPGTAQPRDPPPHRRRRHLPRSQLPDLPRRRVLAEQYDEWAEGRCYLGVDVLARSRISVCGLAPEVNQPALTA
jgi:putative transposase